MVDASSTKRLVRGISLQRDAGNSSEAKKRKNELSESVCGAIRNRCGTSHTSIPAQRSLYLGLSVKGLGVSIPFLRNDFPLQKNPGSAKRARSQLLFQSTSQKESVGRRRSRDAQSCCQVNIRSRSMAGPIPASGAETYFKCDFETTYPA